MPWKYWNYKYLPRTPSLKKTGHFLTALVTSTPSQGELLVACRNSDILLEPEPLVPNLL